MNLDRMGWDSPSPSLDETSEYSLTLEPIAPLKPKCTNYRVERLLSKRKRVMIQDFFPSQESDVHLIFKDFLRASTSPTLKAPGLAVFCESLHALVDFLCLASFCLEWSWQIPKTPKTWGLDYTCPCWLRLLRLLLQNFWHWIRIVSVSWDSWDPHFLVPFRFHAISALL
jgi:hypothetical protein